MPCCGPAATKPHAFPNTRADYKREPLIGPFAIISRCLVEKPFVETNIWNDCQSGNLPQIQDPGEHKQQNKEINLFFYKYNTWNHHGYFGPYLSYLGGNPIIPQKCLLLTWWVSTHIFVRTIRTFSDPKSAFLGNKWVNIGRVFPKKFTWKWIDVWNHHKNHPFEVQQWSYIHCPPTITRDANPDPPVLAIAVLFLQTCTVRLRGFVKQLDGVLLNKYRWATKKPGLTFHYTGCLIGILKMVYYNPHLTV